MDDAQLDEAVAQIRRDQCARDKERREALGPGLHKVGENPWDYVYNPAVGQKVTFVDVDGTRLTGTITDFTEDDETGELQMEVQQFPDAPKWGQFPIAGVEG